MADKFHINKNGDVKSCKASVRECRFGGDEQHYKNISEAIQAAEKGLTNEHNTIAKLNKVNDKVNLRNNKEFLNKIDEVFKDSKDSNGFMKNSSFNPEQLTKVGEVFDEELSNRLSFDPFSKSLSQEEYDEIQSETHKLMSELMNVGSPLKNEIYGTMSKQLNKAVSVLPNTVKNILSSTPIMVKATRSDNNQFDGQHMGNTGFKVNVISKNKKMSEFEKQDATKVPDNSMFFKDYNLRSEIESKGFGSIAAVKRSDDTYDEIWVGRKSSAACGKKISDSCEIYVNGQKTTLNQPVYEYKYQTTITGSVILAKKTDLPENQNSVLLHEYVHLVQQHDRRSTELDMFNKLAKKDEEFDYGNGDGVYRGFPDEYMGLRNGRELLTRASEALYYPAATSTFLYGANRGENADEVRKWIMGYWITKDRMYKNN